MEESVSDLVELNVAAKHCARTWDPGLELSWPKATSEIQTNSVDITLTYEMGKEQHAE